MKDYLIKKLGALSFLLATIGFCILWISWLVNKEKLDDSLIFFLFVEIILLNLVGCVYLYIKK